MRRGAGILLPIFSLPNKYTIGSLGKGAFAFVDFLKNAGQTYWQILPLVQTGYGDSPYQSVYGKSGNPYFIDLEILFQKRLLTKREVMANIDKSERIDYGMLYGRRYPLLRKAFSRFDVESADFQRFLKKGSYDDYATFMALRDKFGSPFYKWSDEYKYRDKKAIKRFRKENEEEILFWQFLQYEFFSEWSAVKRYANSKGIKIIGDMPLYVAADSVEVWTSPDDFMLDAELKPLKVAGVPPDYFCADGQLWGNPVYNYDNQEKNGYALFTDRTNFCCKIYDYVRIDHFRGLDRFWAVPFGEETARNGEWLSAPRVRLFEKIDLNKIIAEDLGVIDDGVRSLVKEMGIPNMKVLSFAFDGNPNNEYLPWKVRENSVYYTGTHDNNTVVGLYEELADDEQKRMKEALRTCLSYFEIYKSVTGKNSIADAMFDVIYASRANAAIIPMHDVLMKNGSYRINEPATASGNWQVKYKESVFTPTVAEYLRKKVKRFERKENPRFEE